MSADGTGAGGAARRPEYGEYATPEEQQRAKGLPAEPPDSGGTPAVVPAGQGVPDALPASGARSAEKSPSRHPVDRVVTFILLAFGLFTVLNSAPGYLSLPEVLQGVYDSLGAGTYTAAQTAATLGVAAVVVQAVLWLATAVIAFTVMRRGRISWWIAVVGGVLNFIVVMVIVSVALFADPGFLDSMTAATINETSF